MSQQGVLRTANDHQLLFWCEGCDEYHMVRTAPSEFRAGAAVWQWNGSFDRPTFQPSVLVRSGHFVPGQTDPNCWCTYEARLGEPSPFKCYVCHSFVTDGRIQYLDDCTHALAGQTVELKVRPE